MKLNISTICFLLAGYLQAQTLTDGGDASEEFSALLELPPVTVIDGKNSSGDLTEEAGSEEKDNPDDKVGEAEGKSDDEEVIQIQIEKIAGKLGVEQEPGSVQIDAPWPAKPISIPPSGWKFAPAPKDVEPFSTQVTLSSGNEVELSITPYILVPLSDGITSIKISEPGYEAALQYGQENTLGIMLQNSTTEIEKHEKQAAATIQQLQQLLSSLPRQKNE